MHLTCIEKFLSVEIILLHTQQQVLVRSVGEFKDMSMQKIINIKMNLRYAYWDQPQVIHNPSTSHPLVKHKSSTCRPQISIVTFNYHGYSKAIIYCLLHDLRHVTENFDQKNGNFEIW